MRWIRAAAAVVSVAGLIMLCSGLWIASTFGDIEYAQFAFVLEGGAEGVAGAGTTALIDFIVLCLVVPVVIVALAVAVGRRATRRPVHAVGTGARNALAPLGVLACSVLALGGVTFFESIGFRDHLAAATYEGSIDAYYVEPSLVSAPDRPLNLIVIYLESFDDAYSDPDVVGENLLAPLTRATDEWMRWDSFVQQPGTGWTIAGIVATQCGIPLKSAELDSGEFDGNEVGEAAERFLPGARCLGDVLDEQGYRSVFLGGADASFAGKGAFLREHGYQEVIDERVLRSRGETEFSSWGLYDDRLFEQARDELEQLRLAGEPYNLTILTLDTHEPGLVGPGCEAQGRPAMRAAVRCTADVVADFIEDLEDDGVLADTAVVLMGDHLAMLGAQSEFREELGGVADRSIFHRVWSPLPLEPVDGSIDHFSMFPTMLRILGMDFPERRLGLGLSAVDEGTTARSLYELTENEQRRLLDAPSTNIYERFWGARSDGGDER